MSDVLTCSSCGAQYVGERLACVDCGIPLVDGPRLEPGDDEVGYDLADWGAWNPLYTRAEGVIRIGETLRVTMALPGEQPREIRPVVLEWVPNDQLHFQVKALGGLVRATRYVEIEELAPGSCIVTTGEILGGLLAPYVAGGLQARLYRGFKAMNEALKARAEA